MDKEKQREALIEYMKMQQQKIRPSVNAADSIKPNMNNNNINKNVESLVEFSMTTEQFKSTMQFLLSFVQKDK